MSCKIGTLLLLLSIIYSIIRTYNTGCIIAYNSRFDLFPFVTLSQVTDCVAYPLIEVTPNQRRIR